MTMTETMRPLAEKQARIRTIATLMGLLTELNYIGGNKMGDFSFEEVQSFHSGVELLEHFVEITSIRT